MNGVELANEDEGHIVDFRHDVTGGRGGGGNSGKRTIRHLRCQDIFSARRQNEGQLVIRHLGAKPGRTIHLDKRGPLMLSPSVTVATPLSFNPTDTSTYFDSLSITASRESRRIVLAGATGGADLQIDRRQLRGKDIHITKLLFGLRHQAFAIPADQRCGFIEALCHLLGLFERHGARRQV